MGTLISAPWEFRSIGLPSFIVDKECYKNFSVDALQAEIACESSNGIFVSARVEKEDYSVNQKIQKAEFYFIEQTLDPHASLKNNDALASFIKEKTIFVPVRYKSKALSINTLDKNNKESCVAVEACARESFSDDRFHMDPNCPGHIADVRFFNWAKDLIADFAVTIYVLCVEDEIAGFLARKDGNMILAGFSKRYIGAGLGQFLWLGAMEAMLSDGVTLVDTRISANNAAVMNLYARLGFKFKNPAAIFHYWKWPE